MERVILHVCAESAKMKKVNLSLKKPLPRRRFLKGVGAALALPWLDAMQPAFAKTPGNVPPRRFVGITLSLGLHAPNLRPQGQGRDYEPSLYLSKIPNVLDDVTVISGASHPRVSGGHQAEGSILTGAPYSRNAVFKNSISIDQELARRFGSQTRFPSLTLNVTESNSPAYSENGSMIPAEFSPSKLYKKLFVADSVAEQNRQIERLRQGRSVMDIVSEDARRLQRELGTGDRDKLDQYFTAVRNFEKRLSESENWVRREKPVVRSKMPIDIDDNNAVVERMKLLMDVIRLALETDSTRFVTLHLNGNAGAIPIEGVRQGYHGLSHHGRDEEKIEQLTLVETEIVAAWGAFLEQLKAHDEQGSSLLDQTNVLLTSNLGNASSHDNKNLPVLFAGGGFRHGQHLAFDQKNNYPLGNLFVSVLQRHGVETNHFSQATAPMRGLEMV